MILKAVRASQRIIWGKRRFRASVCGRGLERNDTCSQTGLPMPRLLLITASAPSIRRARRARVLSFQQITMPYLAARVPPHWEVLHVDEEAEPIDWNLRPD